MTTRKFLTLAAVTSSSIAIGVTLALTFGPVRRARATPPPRPPAERLAPLSNADLRGVAYSDPAIAFATVPGPGGEVAALDADGHISVKVYRRAVNNTPNRLTHRNVIQFARAGAYAPCPGAVPGQPQAPVSKVPVVEFELPPIDLAPGGRENSVTPLTLAVPPGDYDLVIVTVAPGIAGGRDAAAREARVFYTQNPDGNDWKIAGRQRRRISVK